MNGALPKMRLKEVRTSKLFGLFSHRIPLRMEDRITIIHGPNGFGKTVVLRMISGLLQSRRVVIPDVPFEKVTLLFDDGREIRVTKSDTPSKKKRQRNSFAISIANESGESFELGEANSTRGNFELQNRIADFVPFLTRIDDDLWLDRSHGDHVNLEEILERYESQVPVRSRQTEYPEWFQSLRSELNVHFIRANRLERAPATRSMNQGRKTSSAVDSFAVDLAVQIQKMLADYAELSQQLDRSFPQRLVSREFRPALPMDEVRARLAKLEHRRNELTQAGLLDKDVHSYFAIPVDLDESKLDVLSVYIDDVEKKLAVFDALYSKIDLFKRIVNKRFKYKSISINKTQGFVLRTQDERELDADSLSSGEQHEIVLLFQLLFRVTQDSLILIDEPELSLHIEWQQQFLADLEQITSLAKFDVIIATHSPQVISNRWDLTEELRAPENA